MKRAVLCVCGCGREGAHEGRGLIKSCYLRERDGGNLAAFPRARRPYRGGPPAGLTLEQARRDERAAYELYEATQKAAARARAHLTAMQSRRRLLEGAGAQQGRAA